MTEKILAAKEYILARTIELNHFSKCMELLENNAPSQEYEAEAVRFIFYNREAENWWNRWREAIFSEGSIPRAKESKR